MQNLIFLYYICKSLEVHFLLRNKYKQYEQKKNYMDNLHFGNSSCRIYADAFAKVKR